MNEPMRVLDWRWVHGAAVLGVLGLFLFELGDVLSPLVLFVALLALMTPYTGSTFHRLVVTTAAVLLALWLLRALGTLLAPFVLAFVLAYILDPAVDRLERLRLPRPAAILVLALPVAGLLVLLVAVGIPALTAQVESLIRRAPELVDRMALWIEGLRQGLLGLDIPFVDERELAARLRTLTPDRVTAYLQERRLAIAQHGWQAVLGLGRGLAGVFTVIGYVVLTPVLTFYLLRDYDGMMARLSTYVPRPRQAAWSGFVAEYDLLLSRYLRGQLIEAALVGVLTWLGLWIAGFPYSGLVGAVAGVFNLVPYLGLVVSLVPGLIIAVVSGGFLANLLKLALVFFAVQFLDGNVLGPRIVGGSVGLHPVWVMLAIAVAAFFFGFVGLLLAIPGAILIKLLLTSGLRRYRESALYLGEAEGQ